MDRLAAPSQVISPIYLQVQGNNNRVSECVVSRANIYIGWLSTKCSKVINRLLLLLWLWTQVYYFCWGGGIETLQSPRFWSRPVVVELVDCCLKLIISIIDHSIIHDSDTHGSQQEEIHITNKLHI